MSAADRSLRSVFVGNIPYEITEERLKDIFSEVGPVISFRLVFDRDTGKPKGYGFCEYQDQETALSAMRNLNGYELSGRSLRVDNATSEKNREELKTLQQSQPLPESPYGDAVPPQEAPEAISRAVASLPPEQMYEVMKQMKIVIQNNPVEARNMLLQNPQLAYALLQAQVVMRIVDPNVAMTLLHRQTDAPQPMIPPEMNQGPGPQQGMGMGGPRPDAQMGPGGMNQRGMNPNMGPGMNQGPMGPRGMGPQGMGPQEMGRGGMGPQDRNMQGGMQRGGMGPGDMGRGGMGPGDMNRGGMGPGDMDRGGIGPGDMGRGGMGPGDMGRGGMGPGDMGRGGMGPGDMNRGGMGPGDMNRGGMGPGDMGRGGMGPGDMGRGEMGRGDMGRGDMGRGDMGRGDMGRGGMGQQEMGMGGMGPGPRQGMGMSQGGMNEMGRGGGPEMNRGMGPGQGPQGRMHGGMDQGRMEQGRMNMGPGGGGPGGPGMSPNMMNQDMQMNRGGMGPGPRGGGPPDSMVHDPRRPEPRGGPGGPGGGFERGDPRGMGGMRPSGMGGEPCMSDPRASDRSPITGSTNISQLAQNLNLSSQTQPTQQDQEKAALIMQVLQLSPDQINLLPAEQRASIMVLKEQISRSQGGLPS